MRSMSPLSKGPLLQKLKLKISECQGVNAHANLRRKSLSEYFLTMNCEGSRVHWLRLLDHRQTGIIQSKKAKCQWTKCGGRSTNSPDDLLLYSPPPKMSVANCHWRMYLRHLPSPTGVMLKEHMGSPAIVSAPSCKTTALGLKAMYTSFSTL